MDFSSIEGSELEKLIDGWEISGNTIYDNRGNSYLVREIEKFDNYAEVILEDGNKGFILKGIPYLWKGSLRNGKIERIDGKFAIYYNGNVSRVYDEVDSLKTEEKGAYWKVKEDGKYKLVILDEKLNELVKSKNMMRFQILKLRMERFMELFGKMGSIKLLFLMRN